MIWTKFLSPGNVRGSRIQVKFRTRQTQTQGVTYWSYRHELSSDENHIEAARVVAKRLGWEHWVISPNFENGYIFLECKSMNAV